MITFFMIVIIAFILVATFCLVEYSKQNVAFLNNLLPVKYINLANNMVKSTPFYIDNNGVVYDVINSKTIQQLFDISTSKYMIYNNVENAVYLTDRPDYECGCHINTWDDVYENCVLDMGNTIGCDHAKQQNITNKKYCDYWRWYKK